MPRFTGTHIGMVVEVTEGLGNMYANPFIDEQKKYIRV